MDILLRKLLIQPPFSALYALPEPQLTRTRPMQVLALGLPRCGTESLKLALHELGYQNVYHGFEITGNQAMSWCKLFDAKFKGKGLGMEIVAEDFDRIIGDYEAVTDAPTCWFGEELCKAYPDAKIILNRRKDVDAWEHSFQNTLIKVIRDTRWLKVLAWLSADYFWLRQLLLRLINDYFEGSFEKHGKQVFEEHYRKLEELLGGPGSGRYLSWTVEDGWEPLCDFLGKDVPRTPFPSGNAPDAFTKRIRQRRDGQIKTARQSLIVIGGSLLVVGLALGLRYWDYGK